MLDRFVRPVRIAFVALCFAVCAEGCSSTADGGAGGGGRHAGAGGLGGGGAGGSPLVPVDCDVFCATNDFGKCMTSRECHEHCAALRAAPCEAEGAAFLRCVEDGGICRQPDCLPLLESWVQCSGAMCGEGIHRCLGSGDSMYCEERCLGVKRRWTTCGDSAGSGTWTCGCYYGDTFLGECEGGYYVSGCCSQFPVP